MARNDLRNFVLDIAEECDVTDRRFLLVYSFLVRFEDQFVAAVSKKQSPALMGCLKDDYEGSEHLLAARSIDVRFEERSFAWPGATA
jgi:hypothetical protein